MRVVCLSDTHTYGKRLEVPDGDLLIHAGDHTFRGTLNEIKPALRWLDSLPHPNKVIIAGNHDFYFDESFPDGHLFRSWRIDREESVADLLAQFPTLQYLQDSGTEVNGYKIWGSPWQPWYHDWAFNLPIGDNSTRWNIDHDRMAAKEIWKKIPEDTQILITHSPPQGILDDARDASKLGCPQLRNRVGELIELRLHVFGHIHEGYGRVDYQSGGRAKSLTFVNAANNNIEYDPDNLNPPIVVDL